ncbi:hypothetical protein [Arenimonas aestuarii]
MAPSTRRLLPACLAALLCCACGGTPDSAPGTLVEEALEANARQQAADGQAAVGERTLTLETEAGIYRATSGDNLALPEDFPDDVSLPRDASITSATRLGATVSLGVHSPRGLAMVFEEFRKAQRAAGWTEVTVQADATVRVAGFDKDSRHLEADFVEETGGGTTLALTVGPAGD